MIIIDTDLCEDYNQVNITMLVNTVLRYLWFKSTQFSRPFFLTLSAWGRVKWWHRHLTLFHISTLLQKTHTNHWLEEKKKSVAADTLAARVASPSNPSNNASLPLSSLSRRPWWLQPLMPLKPLMAPQRMFESDCNKKTKGRGLKRATNVWSFIH